ncbi:MAG: N-acetylmuramoyl-L-alanine amidase [Peptococcaceae bacterium]|nr:N-acetylmuramoyl-L-alanine amidase [Peptococcaceae bacterium]
MLLLADNGNKGKKTVFCGSLALFFLVCFTLLINPPAALADQAVVKEDLVNLRASPGTGSGIVGKAVKGETLEVLGREGDWLKVSRNGLACWVAGWLVEVRQSSAAAAGPVAGQAVVKEDLVNLRAAPGTGSGIVGKAAKGETLEVLGREGDWLKVSRNGLACWVAGWLVEYKQGSTSGNPVQASPPAGGSASFTAEITGDGVNVRGGPGTSYNIVGQASKGDKYSLLDKSGDWYKISLGGGSGWVYGQYVKVLGESSSPPTAVVSGWAVINGTGVNIRKGPGTNYQVVTRADLGDRFLLADRSADWYKIILDNGNPGWVASWLVKVENSPAGGDSRPAEENPVSRAYNRVVPPPSPPAKGDDNVQPDVLKSVSARVEGGNTVVTVEAGKGPVSSEIIPLTGPERLVIDLKGVQPGQALKDIQVSSPLAGGIRVGWLSKDPCVTRIVVDLKDRVNYEKSLSSDGRRLQVVIKPRVARSLKGARIILDPGHGGSDPGASGPTGLKEKDVNLDIALKAAGYLRKEGATVILTRTGDSYVDLAGRPNAAGNKGADLFVSIHSNANPSSGVSGTSTYYLRNADQETEQVRFEGMYLAKYLQSSLVSALKRTDKGVLQADFVVLVKSKVPAALVEVAYISNPEEERMLRDEAFRDRAAQALVRGISDYLAGK